MTDERGDMLCGYCDKPIMETCTGDGHFGAMHIHCWHLAKDRHQLRDPVVGNCPWWIRWYHRRCRRLDVQHMWPAIQRAANRSGYVGAFSHELRQRAEQVWALFKSQPGQEHWRCRCAQREPSWTIHANQSQGPTAP